MTRKDGPSGGKFTAVIRRVVRGSGKTLIASGVLILLFVAYQLWGTGLHEARAQSALEDKFVRISTPPTTVANAERFRAAAAASTPAPAEDQTPVTEAETTDTDANVGDA